MKTLLTIVIFGFFAQVQAGESAGALYRHEKIDRSCREVKDEITYWTPSVFEQERDYPDVVFSRFSDCETIDSQSSFFTFGFDFFARSEEGANEIENFIKKFEKTYLLNQDV